MGNQSGSEQESEANFQGYISQLHFMRKEHSPNIGRDVDLYKDLNPEFPEELVLLYEITFDEDSQDNDVEKLERFKKEVKKRKFMNSVHLSQLLFVNYKVLNGLCLNKVMCRITLQYSDQNLAKIIHQTKVIRGSQLQNQFVAEQQVINFLHQMSDALVCLQNNGEVHGFIMPENVLILNKNSTNPIFKLLEVSLLSRYHNSLDRMSHENDYFAPLDPSLLSSLAQHQPSSYHPEHDIWQLGITTLCYIFNEDFSIFYDWNAKQIRQQKIDQFIQIMHKVNYSQNLLQLINGMLQAGYSRIDAETIFNKTFQQILFCIQWKVKLKKIKISVQVKILRITTMKIFKLILGFLKRSIQRYEVGDPLGRGKYSEVFVGYDSKEEKQVVIKFLKPVRKQKIKREISILQKLKNAPHVIELLDVCIDPFTKTVALIFEFFSPKILKPLQSDITLDHIKIVLKQVLQALSYCHSKGIMHRDVKPNNIIINRNTAEIKLIDWGLSEYYLPKKNYPTRVSSRPYKSPELLVEISNYNFSMDIWGVGCVLGQYMFKKQYLFLGKDNWDQLVQIVNFLGYEDFYIYLKKYGVQLESGQYACFTRQVKKKIKKKI